MLGRESLVLLCILACTFSTGKECFHELFIRDNVDTCMEPIPDLCKENDDLVHCLRYILRLMEFDIFEPFEDYCVHDKPGNVCMIAVETVYRLNLSNKIHLICPRLRRETNLCKLLISKCDEAIYEKEYGCLCTVDHRAYVKCRDNVDASCDVLCNRTTHTEYQVQDAFGDVCGELLDKKCDDPKQCERLFEELEFEPNDLTQLLSKCANVESNKCALALKLAMEQNVVVRNFHEFNCLKEPSSAKLCGKITSECANQYKGSDGCQYLLELDPFLKCIDQPTPDECEALCDRKNHSLFNHAHTFFDSCGRLLDHVCVEETKCRTLFDQLQVTSNTTELEKYCTGIKEVTNDCKFLLKILQNDTMTQQRFNNLGCLNGSTPSFCEKFLEICQEESNKTDEGCVHFMQHTEFVVVNGTISLEKYRNLNCLTNKKSLFCEIISAICQEETNKSSTRCIDFTKLMEIPSTTKEAEVEVESEEEEEEAEYEVKSNQRVEESSPIIILFFSSVYIVNMR